MGRFNECCPSLAHKLITTINKATNMRRNVLFSTTLALLLAASLTLAPSAHAQIGIGGGLNFNQLDDISATNANATYESSTGYHVGVFYDLGLGPIAIRPGVMYRQLGTYEFGDIPGVEGEEVDIELNAVEVPIDVRWRVLPLPLVKPYVLAGPVLTFPQSSEDFGSTKSVNLNADIGAGVEITLPGVGLTLMPELRYGIATGSILEDEFEIGGVEVDPQDNPRLNAIMLRLNVRF
jgi:hypothetical protein